MYIDPITVEEEYGTNQIYHKKKECGVFNTYMVLTPLCRNIINSCIVIECNDGDLRLVGGSTSREGNLEICLNNSYGAICDDFWDSLDARVACFQLGFTNGS